MDQAHPPIHPVKKVELNALANEDERKVYELVTRHFLACCSHDAIGDKTTIEIQIPPTPCDMGEIFSANGLMVKQRNYLDVYTYDRWTGKKVPTLQVGEVFKPASIQMTQGHTTPPEPINEADLITLMDQKGIGTDATIPSHISTILKREYAVKGPDNSFTPTKLGLALYAAYNRMGYKLTKPDLRASHGATGPTSSKGCANEGRHAR